MVRLRNWWQKLIGICTLLRKMGTATEISDIREFYKVSRDLVWGSGDVERENSE